MELDDKAKLASRRLNEAINSAAKESEAVKDAIAALREIGYRAKLTFHLDLLPVQEEEPDAEVNEDFTEDDRRDLRRMLIRVK